jgi:hypothetical protein
VRDNSVYLSYIRESIELIEEYTRDGKKPSPPICARKMRCFVAWRLWQMLLLTSRTI